MSFYSIISTFFIVCTLSSCAFKKEAKKTEPIKTEFTETASKQYQTLSPILLTLPMPKTVSFSIQTPETSASSIVSASANGLDYFDKKVTVSRTGRIFTIQDTDDLGLLNQHEKKAYLKLNVGENTYTIEFRTVPAPVTVINLPYDILKEKPQSFDSQRDVVKVAELEIKFPSEHTKLIIPRAHTVDLITEFHTLIHTSPYPTSGWGAGSRDWNSPTIEECGVHTKKSYSFMNKKPTTYILALKNETPETLTSRLKEKMIITPERNDFSTRIDIYAVSISNALEFKRNGKCQSKIETLIDNCHRERCEGANNTGKCEGGRWQLVVDSRSNYENKTSVTGVGSDLHEWFQNAISTYLDLNDDVATSAQILTDHGFKFIFSGTMGFNLEFHEPPIECR